jgi:hypothetical protein
MKFGTLMTSSALAAAMALGLAVNANAAATVTLNSVVGTWLDVDPDAPGGVAVTGLGTNAIQWGGGGQKSGYSFTGTPGGPFNVEEIFNAGTFTHSNFPISSGTSIKSAQLQVDFNVTISDGFVFDTVLTSVFDFTHFETPNSANPCADGGANGVGVNVNGCADRVTFKVNPGATTSVDVGGITYILKLTGFIVDGAPANEFWTAERQNSTAIIQGVLTAVPVPAVVPLMLTGLGALGVFGYRQHRKAA